MKRNLSKYIILLSNRNIFDELNDEIHNLRQNFKSLLQKIVEDVEKTFYSVNIVVVNFQKIYQLLNKLKNRQILIKTRQYLESEIKRNTELEKQLSKNTEVAEAILNKIYSQSDDNLSNIHVTNRDMI